MEARTEDIAALLAIQQLDLDIMRAKKKLDELPQRAKILAIRKKRQAIEGKKSQVDALRTEIEQQLARIQDEDERLAERQRETQGKIDAAKGDYRGVESLSKDLNGMAKRRATLEGEYNETAEKLERAEEVSSQVESALATLASQEEQLVASFQKEGGEITAQIGPLTKQREERARETSSDLLARYEKIAAKSGGVGIAVLSGDRCGACRSQISEGKLLQVRAEAPLSTCPSCKRLLVVGA